MDYVEPANAACLNYAQNERTIPIVNSPLAPSKNIRLPSTNQQLAFFTEDKWHEIFTRITEALKHFADRMLDYIDQQPKWF